MTAGDVIERRDKLASGLRRLTGCVWPEGDQDAHAGRLILWVGDQPMGKAKPVVWPLAKTGTVDLFQPFPIGVDPRGRTVNITLMFALMLIGAIPRMGQEHPACGCCCWPPRWTRYRETGLHGHALSMESIDHAAGPTNLAKISDTERAVYGSVTSPELQAFLNAWANHQLGSPIAQVRFRAGRIDVVWGVGLEDGRSVVIKTHRSPVDLDAIRVAQDAQRLLSEAGYPSAAPLAGPDEVEGRVLTAETLIAGETPDGRDPASRLLLAEGLAKHIEILSGHSDLVRRAGAGPSWCQYQSGPWPVPHDTLVDFRSTPDGFEWLDVFGQRAADQILAHRDAEMVVAGHADWYAGNTAISKQVLVGTFDWELVADTEAVIAGFAAACYAASSTGGGGLSTPEEVALFMSDYDTVRPQRLSTRERRTAAGAAAWICAFNARWQVGLIDHGLCDEATVSMVQNRGEEYLSLSW